MSQEAYRRERAGLGGRPPQQQPFPEGTPSGAAPPAASSFGVPPAAPQLHVGFRPGAEALSRLWGPAAPVSQAGVWTPYWGTGVQPPHAAAPEQAHAGGQPPSPAGAEGGYRMRRDRAVESLPPRLCSLGLNLFRMLSSQVLRQCFAKCPFTCQFDRLSY